MRKVATLAVLFALVTMATGLVAAQQATPTPHERIKRSWHAVHKKLMDMAEDFPEDLYDYRPHPDVRSFGEELMHLAQVDTVVAQIASGRTDSFGTIFQELNEEYKYTSKADTVAKLKKSIEDCEVAVNAEDNSRLIGLIEHAGEHYGKLVVHYRNNGLVPPSTRARQQRSGS
ncbi:MAG: DinB family protein [Terriglobia bacterium]